MASARGKQPVSKTTLGSSLNLGSQSQTKVSFSPEAKTRPVAPKIVKFFGRTINIEYKAKSKDFTQDGLYEGTTNTATISTGQQLLEEADTVLHELFHAIDQNLDLRITERQIRLSVSGLIGMLNDNPELFSYLASALGHTITQATSK